MNRRRRLGADPPVQNRRSHKTLSRNKDPGISTSLPAGEYKLNSIVRSRDNNIEVAIYSPSAKSPCLLPNYTHEARGVQIPFIASTHTTAYFLVSCEYLYISCPICRPTVHRFIVHAPWIQVAGSATWTFTRAVTGIATVDHVRRRPARLPVWPVRRKSQDRYL